MDGRRPWVDRERALRQWDALRQTHLDLGHDVEVITAKPGLPDMVCAANGGLVIEGRALGLNAVSDGRNVVLPSPAVGLPAQLRERGYEPVGVDLGELLKAGGSVECCTLEIRA